MFVDTAWSMLGRPGGPLAHDTLARWALLLPLGELATGVLLAVRGLRRYGLAAAAVLHVSLMIVLGPWGLNHRWGVLVWNASFLTLAILLFRCSTNLPKSPPASYSTMLHGWLPAGRGARVALVPILLALALPIGEPWGLWDPWLSWGLYSTRAASLECYLAAEDVRRLPAFVQPFCVQVGPDGTWVHLATDRWSLELLQVPVYPHERFELGCAWAVIDALPSGSRHVMLVRSASPDRRTGTVQKTRWEGADSLVRIESRFFGTVDLVHSLSETQLPVAIAQLRRSATRVNAGPVR